MSSFDAVMAVMMHDVMLFVWKDTVVVVVVVLVDDIWYTDVVKDHVWKNDDDPPVVLWDCSTCDVSFRPLYHDDVVVRLSCVSYR